MLSKTLLVILTLLSVSGVLRAWRVTYTPERICALKGSSVDMSCTYSYPTSHTVQKTFWFINDWRRGWDPQDLSKYSEYSDRVEYLGKKNNDCAFRINQLRETDSKTYRFRVLTDLGKYTGEPGVTLAITDLQVMVYPDTVTDGQSVRLTCSTSCTLTGRPAFIWYRDGSPLSFTGRSHQFRASREDRSRYTCAVKGYELHSPAVTLNVRYSPKSTSVSVSPSGEIVVGSSVTLTCSSDANPAVQNYSWYKKNARSSFSWIKYGSRYTIEKIQFGDAGEFYCEAQNVIGTDRSPHVNLKVMCLKVEIYPDSAREGEMVTLTCKNTCTRASTFQFYRNGQRLSNIVRNQFTARSDNAGNYSCRALYNNFFYSNAVILRVKYPPKSISVSVSGEIVEGSSVTLTCSSDANPPVQRYTWFKNNRAVSSETGGPEDRYTIKGITLQDAGDYYCEAENGIGTNRSPPKHLDVQYSPRNTSMSVSPPGEIVEGSSVTLTCSSDASPPVQRYTWFKNNRTVSPWRRSSYTFTSITLQDAGEYYCVAENGIGTNRSPPKRVNVQYAPKNTAVSVSPSGEIMAGSSVTLTCSSDANPPVQRYTWFKNNIALASWTGSGLNHTITNIVSEDSGQYYCETRNQHGTQNSSAAVTIDVQYLPKNTSVSVSPSGEIVEGRSMNLTCSSDANPPVQNYTWFKKNDTGVWQAGSGQSLNFSNFRSWNRGQYYCEAQNRLGAQNASALLVTVQGGRSLIAAAAVGVAAILALVFLGVVCMRRRKSTNETGHTEGDGEGNKSPIYGNVSGMAMSHTGTQGMDRDDGEVPLYSSVQPTNICNQEQVLYSTVQNPLTEYEEGVQYASIQFRPSNVAPRSKVQGAEDSCVIYSTVSNCNT